MASLNLPIVATCDTKLGLSDSIVPKGTLGFLQEFRGHDLAYVYWPSIRGHKFAVHSLNDINGVSVILWGTQ